MATKFTRKEPAPTSAGFFSIVSTNWIIIVALLLMLPSLIRWFSNLIAQIKAGITNAKTTINNAENGQSDPSIIAGKSFDVFKKYPNIKPPEMDRYKAVAQKIAKALGTNVEDNHFIANVDLFNVEAWTEDEAGVIKLLKTVPTTFKVVEDLYFHVFTRSRNLKTDLYEYLSESDLNEVRKKWKLYGTQNAI